MLARLALNLLIAVAAASPLVQKRQGAVAIAACSVADKVALTFDDGPFSFTDAALDTLAARGHKATFFLNGQNWGSIYTYGSTVNRMINEKHQVGSHTWSHPHLSALSPADVTSQMVQLDDALVSIIGKKPRYMRPPFFDWSQETLDVLNGLGYKIIHANIDTNDWDVANIGVQGAVDNFRRGLDAQGSIVLAHDVHAATVNQILPAMLDILEARGFKSVTVGECLGEPEDLWYRS